MAPIYPKTIILPRQARDQHRENTLTKEAFLQELLLRGSPAIIAGIQNAEGYSAAALLGPGLEKLPAWLDTYKARVATKVKNGLFEPFIYKSDDFTKTGSGQT